MISSFFDTLTWRRLLLLGCAGLVIAVFVWETSHVVLGFREVKTAHVFPAAVSVDGWTNADAARQLDLTATAPFASFNQDNSAFIVATSSTSTISSDFVNDSTVLNGDHAGDVTQNVSSTSVEPTTTPVALPATSSTSTLSPTIDAPTLFDASSTQAVFPLPPTTVPTTTDSTTTVSLLQSVRSTMANTMHAYAFVAFSSLIRTAYATTTSAANALATTQKARSAA